MTMTEHRTSRRCSCVAGVLKYLIVGAFGFLDHRITLLVWDVTLSLCSLNTPTMLRGHCWKTLKEFGSTPV